VSLRINVDLKELYRRLCEKCKKKMLQYIKEKMDEAVLEQMILGQGGEKSEEGSK